MAQEHFDYRVSIEYYLVGGRAAYLHIEGPQGWIEVDVEVLYNLLKNGGTLAAAVDYAGLSIGDLRRRYETALARGDLEEQNRLRALLPAGEPF